VQGVTKVRGVRIRYVHLFRVSE